jgi:bacteriocin biosynthesis cyclodehydratase domain-containing protein
VLPGIVGCLQANEALKLIAGYGEPLLGRLLTFDAQTTRFAEVKVRRDPACPVCGEGRSEATLHSVDSEEKQDRATPAA